MNLPDEIKTIDEFKEVSITITKSKFISQVYSVSTEIEVKELLRKVKKKYYDASHHCYAYKLADGAIRYSDAGEPNGTAGIRILNALEHFNLSNQLIIVSRYFGGIKLGVGPLGKAYSQAAMEILKNSKINKKQLFQKVTISSGLEQVNSIHKVLSKYESVIISSENMEKLTLECLLKTTKILTISQHLTEISKNTILVKTQSEFVYK